MISKEDIKLLENIFPFWNDIKQNDRAKIILSSRILSLKKDSIFSTPSELNGLLFLKSGKIRFFLSSLEEREIPLYYLNISEMEFFDSSVNEPLSSIEFIAEKNSEILLIPFSVLSLFRLKYSFLENFLRELTKLKFSKSILAIQTILFVPLKNRIIDFLYSFDKVELSLTHEEIARNLGSSREVITRILKQLEKENLLKVERKKIILKK